MFGQQEYPINTPLWGQYFPMTLISHLPFPKREFLGSHPSKVHSLECHGHGFSHGVEGFKCTKPLEHSNMFFTMSKLFQEHLDQGMSFTSLDLYPKMVLKPLCSTMLDLEIPRDICMHLMRSRAYEWSNLGFLSTIISPIVGYCMINLFYDVLTLFSKVFFFLSHGCQG